MMAWYSKIWANLKKYGPALLDAIMAAKTKK